MTDIWFSIAWVCFAIAYLVKDAYRHDAWGSIAVDVLWTAGMILLLVVNVHTYYHPTVKP